MNLVLLLPAALAALAALAVPLLVHLARRQQQVPTMFAALRWLRAKPKPRRRVRFDEWWLLAVRLLLVALLALLLARPAMLGIEDDRPRLLVVPGVSASALDAARQDETVDARWLAPGFPALQAPAPSGSTDTASLLRDFEAALDPAAPLTVVVPEQFAGADADRLHLSRTVEWRVVPGGEAPATPTRIPPPVVAIRHDEAHRDAVRYLQAAAVSWQDADPSPDIEASADPRAALPERADVLAWLRTDALPSRLQAWVSQGGQVLLASDSAHEMPGPVAVAWRDTQGRPLLMVARSGAGRVLRFARPLEPHVVPELLDGGFPRRLRDVLQPGTTPNRVRADDYAPMTGGTASPPAPRELHSWLVVAIALLALIERWLATSRRRWATA